MALSKYRQGSRSRDGPEETEMMQASSIHPEPGILKVQDTVDEYYRRLTWCENCFGKRLVDVPIDGDMYVKRCLDCEHHFGLDDLSSVYSVHECIKTWKAQICSCGNKDLDKYILYRNEGEIGFVCTVCNARHQMSVDEPTPPDSITHPGQCCEANVATADDLQLKCSRCGTETKESFDILRDPRHEQNIIGIKCRRCESQWLNETEDDFTPEMLPKDDQETKPSGRKEIPDAWCLHEGDHIAWWRPEGYWHHALVVSVYPGYNEVNVIHYNGPGPIRQFIKGQVVEELIQLKEEKGLLYRIDYDGECYPADIAILRGRRRLFEKSYNLFTNNCEHFVRWCKTGFEKCDQVESFKAFMAKVGKSAVQAELSNIAKKSLGMFVAGLKAETQAIFKSAAFLTATQVCKVVGVGAMVGLKIYSVVKDIYKARKQRRENKISRDEFINVTVRKTAEGVSSLAGAAVGTSLGQVFCPFQSVGP